ncbi:endonuclease/exonuclease/phosphatase family protein [Olivibacter sp. CPCC 100613]|uniref:endonuclease/exonuclease/phosphatase family protein n=1 Tax=Olivibacter sp. CPCC 100613 TaxID=3079931 RepID=UPI002FF95EBE
MKRKIMVTLCFLLIGVGILQAQQLRIATFNVRYANPGDTGNLWIDRAPVVAALIDFHGFDVFGTQEALKGQLDDISAALPEYERYGVGRDDGKDAGEHSAIYFKKNRFELLKKGDFWLSETPDKPSFGWDAQSHKRICSWVQLRDKESGRAFFVFNAHYDHQGVQARKESSKLILKKIKDIAQGDPAVLTGDMNGSEDTEWYQTLAQSTLLKDTEKLVKKPYKLNASFNGFGNEKSLQATAIIDHIFITKDFKTLKWGVLTDTYHGKFPSDHFPVMVDLEIN